MKRVEIQHQLSKKRQVFDFYVGVLLNLVICKYEPDKGKKLEAVLLTIP
jgi:hypothetical protein